MQYFSMYGRLFCFTHGRKTHLFHFKSFVDTILPTPRIIKCFHKWLPQPPHVASGAPDHGQLGTGHKLVCKFLSPIVLPGKLFFLTPSVAKEVYPFLDYHRGKFGTTIQNSREIIGTNILSTLQEIKSCNSLRKIYKIFLQKNCSRKYVVYHHMFTKMF